MRAYAVDSLAAVIFFTLVATATERLIAGMDWGQVATARAAAVPAMLLTGRPYGMWRDWLLRRLDASRRGPLGHAVLDVAAFMTFQVPVYAAILALAGASPEQTLAALSSATAFMLLLSRPFGLFLDSARRLAGTARPWVG